MLNQRFFPFLRKTEKCVPGFHFSCTFSLNMFLGKFANKLFDGFVWRCIDVFKHVALRSAGVDQGLFGCQGHRCHNVTASEGQVQVACSSSCFVES